MNYISSFQRKLWLLDQIDYRNVAYNNSIAYSIIGKLHFEQFKESIHILVNNHPILETIFFKKVNKPIKERNKSEPINFIEFKLPSIQHIEDFVSRAASFYFSLQEGSLLYRICIGKINDDLHILSFTVHHIISDGLSLKYLIKDLINIYDSIINGTEDIYKLQENLFEETLRLPINAKKRNRDQLYWCEKLGNATPSSLLPDKIRGQKKTFNGDVQYLELDHHEFERITSFCNNNGLTSFMFFIGVFNILIHFYSQTKDLCISFPINTRPYLHGSNPIGPFINMLILRVILEPEENVINFLHLVKNSCIEAYDHKDLPFESVANALKLNGNNESHLLSQIIFVSNELPNESLYCDQVKFNPIKLHNKTSKADITLLVSQKGRTGYQIEVEYNTDLYTAKFIQRMLDTYVILLRNCILNPQQAIRDIEILDKRTSQLITKWNSTTNKSILKKKVPSIIQSFAFNNPERIVVKDDFGNRLSYKELESYSSAIVARLRFLDINKGSFVGLCCERSIFMIVGAYGIMKAGCAYVPILPSTPPERLEYIIKDAALKVIFTDRKQDLKVPSNPEVQILEDLEFSNFWSNNYEEWEIDNDSPAYMIYTSGSTGSPKGVVNHHLGLVNRLVWMREEYKIDNTDIILQKTPFTFDVSIWEMFLPLISGACLFIIKPGKHKNVKYLIKKIKKEKITTIHFVPSMLVAFYDNEKVNTCNSLKRIFMSGEVLKKKDVLLLSDKLPESKIYNLYGPTEAAIDVTHYTCTREGIEDLPSIPIGKPIANTQLYILNSHLKSLPIGAVGELYIGGLNVATGYLNLPNITSMAFLKNPFADGILYKTGDLVRYGEDGSLFYIGRIDNQIKLRGIRIELTEIETILLQNASIRQAVVCCYKDGFGNYSSLVAYITAITGTPFSITTIKRDLKLQLPDYMIPNHIIILKEIPLNSNGKINYNVLTELYVNKINDNYVAPGTNAEIFLATIWQEVLCLSKVSKYANFFSIGGDSIKILEVISKCEERGYRLTISDFYSNPILNELSGQLKLRNNTNKSLNPFALISKKIQRLLPSNVEDAYPLSSLQSGLVYFNSLEYYKVYCTTYRICSSYSFNNLQYAIQLVIEKHPYLRSFIIFEQFNYPLQLVAKKVFINIIEKDIRHLASNDQEEYLIEWFEKEKNTRILWDRPPLLRFSVHLLGDQCFQFTICEPWLDGWSVALFASETLSTYDKLNNGIAIKNVNLLSTYKDFVYVESNSRKSKKNKAFWLKELENAEPFSFPGIESNKLSIKNYVYHVELPAKIYKKLSEVSDHYGLPIKSILLSIHLYTISYLSGKKEVISSVMSNGRIEGKDAEKVVGIFLNPLPLRIKIFTNETWVEFIRRVMSKEQSFLPYRHYPASCINEDVHLNNITDILFNFTNFHPYKNLSTKTLKLIDVKGSDQTFFPFTAQFSLHSTKNILCLDLEFNTSSNPDQVWNDLSRIYKSLLLKIIYNPLMKLEDFDLVTYQDKKRILSLNHTNFSYPSLTIIDYFENIVKKCSNENAVFFKDTKISFKDLNIRINKLANYLIRLGLKQNQRVAVYIERSLESIISAFAIIKIGCIYVPISPRLPSERVQYILEDAKVALVLCESPFHFGKYQSVNLVEEERKISISEAEVYKTNSFSLSNNAFIIYTSGSTGKPKGVKISHSNAMNRFQWMWRKYPFLDNEKVCHKTALSFIDSIWEIFGALCKGKPISIITDQDFKDIDKFFQHIKSERITRLTLVPSFFELLVCEQSKTIDAFSSMKYLFLSGEKLSSWSVNRIKSALPQLNVINLYGSTEVMGDVTWYECTGNEQGSVIPIGYPIDNTQIYIVNENNQVMPIGKIGEILVCGLNVTEGYTGKQSSSKSSFIDFNYLNLSERAFLTKDLGYYDHNGCIHILGRKDSQIKINGIRVNPKEIEFFLLKHQAIKNVAVVNQKNKLFGYIVLNDKIKISRQLIVEYLSKHVPYEMIPEQINFVSEIPYTINGKVDCFSLINNGSKEEKVEFKSPSSELEKIVVNIYKAMFENETISMLDNFYSLGGNSLNAIQLVSKLNRRFCIDLKINEVFSAAMIKDIVFLIEDKIINEINHATFNNDQ